jgi:ABC-type ATPase with predicted acetyltransferase domain
MRVEVLNKTSDFNTYRAARVKSLFNASDGSQFALSADIPIDGMEWQIGLIVGQSGSGKTSIGKQILGGNKIVDLYANWPKDLPIVEAIGPDADFDEVTGALAGVGLGDVPAWLRPFSALSNGQQFRAGLARVLVSGEGNIVIDEFTSVVDRQIAMIGALAFAKSWRRGGGRRCVLISCHYDIIEWLQPDWVFDTNGTFKKKTTLGQDQDSSLKLGRSISLTGNILNRITI